MAAILVTEAAPNSPEWHAARTTGIGASEISAVVGLNPWESPYSLWLRKKGLIPGPDVSDAMEWGHILEPIVADWFAMAHPEFWVMDIGTHRHDERQWQLANLDRALYPPIVDVNTKPASVLEIKTTRYPDGWGKTGSDEVPLHVRCQVMQQMDVFGAPYAWVAALIGGSDYREYRVDFDEADAAALRDAGAAFWASLQTDDEPPIDASFATYNAVRALHPDIDDDDTEIDPELWVDYVCTKDSADAATERHQQAKSELLVAMGRSKRGLYFGKPVIRRQPGRGNTVALYPIKESA